MSKKTPVLIINSYAGSLTIAAHQERHPVIGSYEDSGYGLAVQRHNFPRVDYRETVDAWPDQDLSDVLVIAHPPCAAFSQQNACNAKENMGLDAVKFQQTKRVLKYALSSRCRALAVESVCGALDGARVVHDELAATYGYDVFRILQNAVSFGVPQWRQRFWVVFLPKGSGDLRLPTLAEPLRRVRDVFLDPDDDCDASDGEHNGTRERGLVEQRRVLTKAFGRSSAERLLDGRAGFGALSRLTGLLHKERTGENLDLAEAQIRWCVNKVGKLGVSELQTNIIKVLDPDGLAPVLLGNSWWVVNGRNLARLEWQRLMGFPDDYDFPAGTHRRQLTYYLSRGVCPPVARYILRSLEVSVTGKRCAGTTCHPGELADLRPGYGTARSFLAAQAVAA